MGKYNWKLIKNDYDKGMTDRELRAKYGMSQSSLTTKRKNEDWGVQNTLSRVGSKKATSHNKSKLSADEIYFCELYAQNIPQYRCYQMAFNRHDMANSRASAAAYELRKRKVIQDKIDEIIQHTQHERGWNFSQYTDELLKSYYLIKASLIDDGVRKANTDAFFQAIDRIKEVFQFDRNEKLKRDETKAKIALLKAKLQAESSADDAQLEQVNKLLDEIDKQL